MRRNARARLAALSLSVSAVVVSAAVAGGGTARAVPAAAPPPVPAAVDGGKWRSGHLQGTALDRDGGFMYFSFTDLLVKTDLRGRPVGSVTGFTGHLGDLDFNKDDGRVYGSLEYKSAKAFYIAIFDGDRITRMNMDAHSTGVVSTVHLKEVVKDYTADMNGDGVFDGNTANTPDHRYGCSGIDGVAFGPGLDPPRRPRLTVAYGVYSNTSRTDNDHQVLLQYDVRFWKRYERPLSESEPHTSGPARPDGKFFVYTGNTTYGVQNLEYDAHSGDWRMAVYKGKKKTFPNYSFFVIDGSERTRWGLVRGQASPEVGRMLTLAPRGLYDEESDVYGYQSAGQYGLVSLDDGRFYVAEAGTAESDGVTLRTGRAVLHRWTGLTPNPFEALRRR
ncbi:hypothetical protein GCM10010387_67310 [Streptomyces inusitatus]|uniref:Uncharacterized protein n=1 Tax=Streptomyces inusitatus TaxID=68221 RepID=A0A918QSG2_9ACTN|nr:hypothetical protein [Streptomyces inusitatus]GGZ64687.1 hypothetical protein GCM10010387_67310 [Streptomyces inusitatus]